MPCIEFHHIQSRIESAREELRNRASEAAPDNEFAVAAAERVARTTLFSAEIDAQFHAARCPQCRSGASQHSLADLAQAT